ncbi:dihydrofolate reductase family protein [Leifsonia sp. P73]|uniref:dihydrofolate reductase family protein n=1 Tax=Leifsonia sp. P73 TaxID=3423959 RepID=UPI003DA56D0A
MRKIVVYELVSLDGVAEDPDGFIPDWDEDMDANLGTVIGSQDAVILGRRSYDDWARYWPGKDIQPFSDFINGVTKYIATSAPLSPEWSGAQAVDGDIVEFARRLKEGDGGDIGVHASISVAQALLAGGVVDELRLVIAPGVAERGRRLLEGVPALRFETIASGVSSTGYLLLGYRVLP